MASIGANALCSSERLKLSSHWSPHATPLMKKLHGAQLLEVEPSSMRQASESLQKHGSPLHLPFSVSFAAAVETRTAHNKLWLRKANVMPKREATADKRILTQDFLIKTSRNFFTDDIDFVPEVRHIQSFNQINTWKCEQTCCLVTFSKPYMET